MHQFGKLLFSPVLVLNDRFHITNIAISYKKLQLLMVNVFQVFVSTLYMVT